MLLDYPQQKFQHCVILYQWQSSGTSLQILAKY